MTFKKAIKYNARGRVALVGPPGSGKSFTMLRWARLLAGPTGKIAAIDTEHGSLSKYADLEDFDVIELDSFSPDNFLAALTEAEKAGYAVFCCDSLSHFWVGKDGALEFVDTRAKRNGNTDSFSGWKDFRPHERSMVDRMIASPCHIIVTMRTKSEYVTEKNDRGKTVRRKIGLAPVQREGVEYEFDFVGTLDEDNTLIVDKTRCPAYAGKAIVKPSAESLVPFAEWLKGAALPPPAQPRTIPGQFNYVAVPASESPASLYREGYVAGKQDARTISPQEPPAGPPMPRPTPEPEPPGACSTCQAGRVTVAGETRHCPDCAMGRDLQLVESRPHVDTQVEALWKRMSDFGSTVTVFAGLKKDISELTGSELEYYKIIERHGMKAGNDLKGKTRGVVKLAVKELFEYVQKCKAAAAPPPDEPPPPTEAPMFEATDDDLPPILADADGQGRLLPAPPPPNCYDQEGQRR